MQSSSRSSSVGIDEIDGAGGPADGRFDLLTVLSHELGHALGFTDAMAGFRQQTVTGPDGKLFVAPGFTLSITADGDHAAQIGSQRLLMNPVIPISTRLIPSEPEVVVLGEGLDIVHRTTARIPRVAPPSDSVEPPGPHLGEPASADVATWSPTMHAAETAPFGFITLADHLQNVTFVDLKNGSFDLTDASDDSFGWATTGNVDFLPGKSRITESDAVFSGISQAFAIPDDVAMLSVTISSVNLAIPANTDMPTDAFELALLNASTGETLAAASQDLSNTDAFFNLQPDGTLFLGESTTVSPRKSSSADSAGEPIVIRVDLSEVPAGTNAVLSLDLIGFGPDDSWVTIDDVRLVPKNGPPTGLTVEHDGNGVRAAENTDGDTVGTVVVEDPDEGDTHTFTLSDDRFEIVDRTLKLKAGVTLDHEQEASVALQITATDSGGLSVTETVTVLVTDLNEGPAGLTAAVQPVAENQPGADAGTVAVDDPDEEDTHTYTLSDDRFEVVDGKLKLKDHVALDFERGAAIPLNIVATDSGGMTAETDVTVTVTDANDVPSEIVVSPSSVPERLLGATVGTLAVIDQDAGDEHTLSVKDDRFEIVGDQLRLKRDTALSRDDAVAVDIEFSAADDGAPPETLVQTVRIDVLANRSPWQNPVTHEDTNDRGGVTPADVLNIVNELNLPRYSDEQTGALPLNRPVFDPLAFFFDVTGDNVATPRDALLIVNLLNRLANAEGEAGAGTLSAVAPREGRLAAAGAATGPAQWLLGIALDAFPPASLDAPAEATEAAAPLDAPAAWLDAWGPEGVADRDAWTAPNNGERSPGDEIDTGDDVDAGDMPDDLETALDAIADDVGRLWRRN